MFNLLVLLFFLTNLLSGQQNAGKFGFGYYLGINEFSGVDGSEDFGYIPIHQLQYSYRLSRFWGIELITGLGYADPDEDETNGNPMTYRTYFFPYHVNVKFMPLSGNKFNPYFMLGYGTILYDVRNQSSGPPKVDLFGFGKGSTVNGNRVNKQLNGGFGLEYFINERFGLDASARYGLYFADSFDESGYGEVNDQNLEARFGISVYFGTKSDRDGDGIVDSKDKAPDEPEDRDCFQDDDGVPDLDNDMDGILDQFDAAPNQPEDKDGFEDDDGIPDLDNDNDMIPDEMDAEPNIAEDFDGFQDDDGKPDPDNDNDGIADDVDLCPNSPETINQYKDDDGCPDIEPVEIVTMEELLSVYFDLNKFIANDDYKAQLKKLAIQLKKEKDVYILIKGFADSIGDPDYNIKLSLRRANWVRNYLIYHGLDENRIGILGIGELKDSSKPEENRKSTIIKLK